MVQPYTVGGTSSARFVQPAHARSLHNAPVFLLETKPTQNHLIHNHCTHLKYGAKVFPILFLSSSGCVSRKQQILDFQILIFHNYI